MIAMRPTKKIPVNKSLRKSKLPEKKRASKKLGVSARLDRLSDDYAALWLTADRLSTTDIDTRIRVNDLEQRVNQIVEDLRPIRSVHLEGLVTRILDLEDRYEDLARLHFELQEDHEILRDGTDASPVDPASLIPREETAVVSEVPVPRLDTFGAIFLVLSSVVLVGILTLIAVYAN